MRFWDPEQMPKSKWDTLSSAGIIVTKKRSRKYSKHQVKMTLKQNFGWGGKEVDKIINATKVILIHIKEGKEVPV